MYDQWRYTVAANTAEADAVKVEAKVSPGILTDLRVFMPPGCADLVKSRVFLGQKPIAPRSEGHYLAGEGYVADLHYMREPIREDLPVLNWYIWSNGTRYSHTPIMDAAWLSISEPWEKQMIDEIRELRASIRGFFTPRPRRVA